MRFGPSATLPDGPTAWPTPVAVPSPPRPSLCPWPPSEPELDMFDHELEDDTARLVHEGLAVNTRIGYARDFAAYAAWCDQTGRAPLPATAATLAAQQYAPSTIDRALACVLAAHDHAQLGKPTTTPA